MLEWLMKAITWENITVTWIKIIETAKRTGCQAIHPAYGFLSENYLFDKACQENNIIFIRKIQNL